MPMPVYDFNGYYLKRMTCVNDINYNNTYISIKVDGKMTRNIYTMTITIKTDFDLENESSFIFEAIFKINDLDWYNHLSEREQMMVLSSVAFPFIRERVYVMTTYLKPGLLIPMLDLKSFDVTKEIRLVKKSNNTEKV